MCELGEAERAEMEILHQDIDSAKKVFQNTNVGRLELEGKKNLLESRLNDHLMRKKQEGHRQKMFNHRCLEQTFLNLNSKRQDSNGQKMFDCQCLPRTYIL